MTRQRWAAGLAAVLVATGLTACGSGGSKNGVVTLRFQSLAFQKPTIAATKNIVNRWNADHPKIQVKLSQGSWDSVHDQLVTQFVGDTAPDIVHDEAADINEFAQEGYLADLTPYLSDTLKGSVPQGVIDAVTVNKRLVAAPTLLQSYVVIANTDLLKKEGIDIPSGSSLSWDQLRSMAKQATSGKKYGLGWGLKQPTAALMSLALNFDGTYFSGNGRQASVKVGDAEKQVPGRIHAMAYDDRSIDPVSLTQGGTDVLPSFYAGKTAMVVQGNYVAQQISEEAPKNFHWAILPPLRGSSTDQAADPQTLSVSAASKHVKDAAEFLKFFMQSDNLAALGQGDWLVPSTRGARGVVEQQTKGADGWAATLAAASTLVEPAYQRAANFPRWRDQIATPTFQQYLQNKIGLGTLGDRLRTGWNDVNH
jgi:multiple sugar transport system substrate-binding protein